MGVAAHLGIRIDEYDEMIRTFIPDYEPILDAAAATVATLGTSKPTVVDLGTGSGALANRVIRACRGATVIGIDADDRMLALARSRVRGRLRTISGNFLKLALPRCDVVTASFSLHHIRTRREKGRLYASCFAALRPGGILVNADCCLSSNRTLQSRDRAAWHAHLAQTYGRVGAERHLRAWADEDFYFTLDQERAMMARVGFEVDVVWRANSFGVVVGCK